MRAANARCLPQEIKSSTAIPDVELKRQLQSLACAKYKILKKHPPGREVSAGDSFSFNADFSAPLQKIKISTVASRVENTEERKETKDRIDEERRHQTEVRPCFPVPCLRLFHDYVRLCSPRGCGNAGVHRAHHEGPEAYDAQRPGERGDTTAREPLPAEPDGDQETHRGAHRGMSILWRCILLDH